MKCNNCLIESEISDGMCNDCWEKYSRSFSRFLKNVDISIDQETEFGPIETICVKLYFDGELISESSCALPERKE